MLQCGQKALARRNTRSPATLPELFQESPREIRTSGKLVIERRLEQDRDQRINDSKATRKKKIKGLDQTITNFIKQCPAWQETTTDRPDIDEKIGRILAKKDAENIAAEKPFDFFPTQRATVRDSANDHSVTGMAATGVGVFSPGSPARLPTTVPQTGDQEMLPRKTDTMPSKVVLKRKEPSVAELMDGSMTRKLKYLREQRLAQAPRYTEHKLANPIIRTHRGEEPFEGPVNLVPYNFPGKISNFCKFFSFLLAPGDR